MRLTFRTLLIILLPVLFFIHFFGVNTSSEGFILSVSQRIANGELPYRDFYFNNNPLSIFLTAFSFVVLGESILSSRILIALVNLLSCLLIFSTLSIITRKKVYGFFAVLVYLAWGPLLINYSWPALFSLFFSFLTFFLLQSYNMGKKNIPFLAGAASFFSFFSSIEIGIASIITVVLFFLLGDKKLNNITNSLTTFVWGIIFLLIYFISQDLLGHYLANLKITLDLIGGIEKTIQISNIDTGTFLSLFHIMLLPIMSTALLLLLIYRKKKNLIFIPFFGILISLSWLLTKGLILNVNLLLALFGIVTVIFMNKLPTAKVKFVGYLLLTVLAIDGFLISPLFSSYKNGGFVYSAEKILVYTSNKFYRNRIELIKTLGMYSQGKEFVYVDPDYSIFYFTEDLKNPGPYFVALNNNHLKVQSIYAMVGKDVKVALIREKQNEDSFDKFILGNYSKVGKIEDIQIFIKP